MAKKRGKSRPTAPKSRPQTGLGERIDAALAGPGEALTRNVLLALAGVALLGLLLRLMPLAFWQQTPESRFLDGEPILTNVDGYYYLNIARFLEQGDYPDRDDKLFAPQGIDLPETPPLLSVLTAAAPGSRAWAAALLPAFLGALLALPIFFLGRAYGGDRLGLWAAFFAAIAFRFLERSSAGWFDTDSLNVVLPMACACCFLHFATRKGRARYLSLAAGLASVGLFVWWWDQATLVSLALGFAPLALALALEYRPKTTAEALAVYGASALAALGLFLLFQEGGLAGVFGTIARMAGYVGKEVRQGGLPPIAFFTSEQQAAPLWEIVTSSLGLGLGFAAGVAGLILLAARKTKKFLYILPVAALAVLSLQARRFEIFLAPVLALGAGAAVVVLARSTSNKKLGRILAGLLAAAVALGSLYQAAATRPRPLVDAGQIKAITWLRDNSPADSLVWSSWSLGYPLRYFADRAVILDGAHHTSINQIVGDLPLATRDWRLAAQWMRFYATQGMQGIEEARAGFGPGWGPAFGVLKSALAVTPDQAAKVLEKAGLSRSETAHASWLARLFPARARPIYLFLRPQILLSDWLYLGSWSFPATPPPRTAPAMVITDLKPSETGYVGRALGLRDVVRIDTGAASLSVGGMKVPLSSLTVSDGRRLDTRNLGGQGPALLVNSPGGLAGALQPADTDRLLPRLILSLASDPRFVREAHLGAEAQIWRVGEKD